MNQTHLNGTKNNSDNPFGFLDNNVKCSKCNDVKYLSVIKDGYEYFYECDCLKAEINLERIRNSGMASAFSMYSFDNYVTPKSWQKKIKEKAYSYSNKLNDDWFYVGGQNGAGKTHVATAICKRLINSNSLIYQNWIDISNLKYLKGEEEYNLKMSRLKRIKVLYIDDFFKVQNADVNRITSADVSVAFELINHRYVNNLKTIISGEFSAKELVSIDEAVASRIMERCNGNFLFINRDTDNNFRLHKFK